MSRDSVLARGREKKNSLMPETVRVVIRTETTNPTTRDVEHTDSAPLYEGIARYKAAGRALAEAVVAGQSIVTQQAILEIPTGSPALPIDAVVIIDESTVDGALVGVETRIADRPERGQTTAHKYPLKEVSA